MAAHKLHVSLHPLYPTTRQRGTQTDKETSCCNNSQQDITELLDTLSDSRVIQVKVHTHFQKSHTLYIRLLTGTPAQFLHCVYCNNTQ